MPLFNVIKTAFHLKRNDYDRFGHVVQGIVPYLMMRELLAKGHVVSFAKRGWLNFIAVAFTLAVSATYELAEFAGAAIAGNAAEDFLGTQGDPWDTQWDMISALIGALLGLAFFRSAHDRMIARSTKQAANP